MNFSYPMFNFRTKVISLVFLLLLLPAMLLAQRPSPEPIPAQFLREPGQVHQMLKSSNEEQGFLFIGDYEDYYRRHPEGFRQFSPARLEEFEKIFPDKYAPIVLFGSYDYRYYLNAFHEIKSMGYSNISAVKGGIEAWENARLPVVQGDYVTYHDTTYSFEPYEDTYRILKIDGGRRDTVARFVDPAYSLYVKYRRYPGWNEDGGRDLFRRISGFHMSLGAPVVHQDKIWFGIGIYEGEGYVGYGGIGFYDPKKNQLGVLRHPALVGCSVREILFRNRKLYVATFEQNELSSSLCNGVVALDLHSFEAVSIMPPVDSNLLWHKDMATTNAERYYDKLIREILADDRFERDSTVFGWGQKKQAKIKRMGLEAFMLDEYKREMEARKRAVANPVVALDTTVVYRFEDPVRLRSGLGYGLKITKSDLSDNLDPQSMVNMYINLSGWTNIIPDDDKLKGMLKSRDASLAVKGKKWTVTGNLRQYTVVLKDFKLGYYDHQKAGKLPRFEEVTFRVKVGELRN